MAAPKKKNSASITVPTPKSEPEKTCTLDQFRAWLSGVEEMQEEGWVPNKAQWARIREKIEQIIAEPAKPFNSGAAGASGYVEQPARIAQPSGPSAFAPVMAAPIIPHQPPSFVATGDMTAKGSQPMLNNKIVTPNVDTSDGRYTSSLE